MRDEPILFLHIPSFRSAATLFWFSADTNFFPTCDNDTGSIRRLAKRLERDRDYLEELGLPTDDAEEVRWPRSYRLHDALTLANSI